MTTLPIIKSFIQPDTLNQIIADRWGYTDVRSQLIKATMRDVYHIWSAQGEFVAIIYRTSTIVPHVINEIALLEFLSQRCDHVVAPIPYQKEETCIALRFPEGERLLVLYPYIDALRFPRQPDTDLVTLYGEILAQIHTLTDTYSEEFLRPAWNADTLIDGYINTIEQQFHDRPHIIEEIHQASAIIRPQIADLDTSAFDYGIIHGDVIPSNALVTENSFHLIDFDLCGWGFRVYDIATFINELNYWQAGDTMTSAFMDGYRSVRQITDNDLALISLFATARTIFELGTASHFVDTWGRSFILSDTVIQGVLQNLRRNLATL